eukprot:scaffold1141_cov128-Isochrysis_galbana.AAC.6
MAPHGGVWCGLGPDFGRCNCKRVAYRRRLAWRPEGCAPAGSNCAVGSGWSTVAALTHSPLAFASLGRQGQGLSPPYRHIESNFASCPIPD